MIHRILAFPLNLLKLEYVAVTQQGHDMLHESERAKDVPMPVSSIHVSSRSLASKLDFN